MGYRSDVFYGAEFLSDDVAEAALNAAILKYFHDKSDFWVHSFQRSNQYILFTAGGVKWYTDSAEVSAVKDMFENFFHKMYDANVRYIREGEDFGDSEREMFESVNRDWPDAFYECSVERKIVTPWGDV